MNDVMCASCHRTSTALPNEWYTVKFERRDGDGDVVILCMQCARSFYTQMVLSTRQIPE